MRKPNLGSGSRLRVGKVLAPYSACPKAVPLINFAKEMCFFLYIYFSQKEKILNKIIFGEKGTRQGLKPWSYVFSLKKRNQGYVVLYKTI